MTGDGASAAGGAAPGRGQPEAALADLGRAVSRAAAALAAPVEDEATAYQCAKIMDAALVDLAQLLRAVPPIVGLGDPGPKVSDRLEQSQAELAARRGEVAGYRESLDRLAESERRLAELAGEAARLSERASELQRAERRAAEVPGLRARVTALEAAVAAAGVADAPELGARLAAAAAQLAALTERQREAIGAEADQLVARAQLAARDLGEQQARRAAALADLAQRERDAAQLAADGSQGIPVLAAWSQADADLAGGLRAAGLEASGSAVDTVAAELAGIRQRLAGLDDSLRPLLAEHARAYEQARRVRPF